MTDVMTELPPPSGPATPPADGPPSVVRGVWKAFAALLVVAALVSGTYHIVVLLAHEERVETSSFAAAAVTRLDVATSSGSVRVVATAGDTIEVRARISDGLRATGESQRVVGDTLELRSTCPNFGSTWCSVDYEVTVPAGLDVTVDTANGSVDVIGTAGAVVVDTDNGSIELDGLSGDVSATSDNGRIEGTRLRSTGVSAATDNGRISLSFAAAPASVVATADNGSIEVVVPDDGEAYRLDVDTDRGSRTELVPTDPDSPRTITLRTDNGSITARTAAD